MIERKAPYFQESRAARALLQHPERVSRSPLRCPKCGSTRLTVDLDGDPEMAFCRDHQAAVFMAVLQPRAVRELAALVPEPVEPAIEDQSVEVEEPVFPF